VLFAGASLKIPPLEPGQTVEMPFTMQAVEYWVPGHLEAMHGWTTVEYRDGWPQYYYDDWWKLYWGGTAKVYAEISACNPTSMSACTINSDVMEGIVLPNSMY